MIRSWLDPQLRAVVERWLAQRWSPQQISRRLLAEYLEDPSMRVSHETIYTSLFVQAKRGLRGELTAHLRTGRVRRRPQRRLALRPDRIRRLTPDSRPAGRSRAAAGAWSLGGGPGRRPAE